MKIFETFAKMLGWVPASVRNGSMVDSDNCYALFEIRNAKEVFKAIINLMPNESIWAIEGIYSSDIIELLSDSKIEDDQSVFLATAWPKQPRIKVKLSEGLKKKISENCDKWNIDKDIVHQHIYKNGFFYFTSYDNLKSGCVWITNKIEREEIERLKSKELIGEYDVYPEEEEEER